MSNQSTQNPTPTVQVKEVGLPDQMSVGKVLAVAGLATGALAGLATIISDKMHEEPPTRAESARAYLQEALEQAQSRDLGKVSRKQTKRAQKALKKQQAKASKESAKMLRKARTTANDTSTAVRGEVGSLVDSLKSGGMEIDRLVEGFAESTLMEKLREFGDEAKVIAEQGKMRGIDAAHKTQEEVVPQVKDAARKAKKVGKERLDEAGKMAKTEFVPRAQKMSEEAKAMADHVGEDAEKKIAEAATAADQLRHDAEKKLSEAAEIADKKRKEATTAVQRGGRETRSLLLWVSLAGILIFTVFLDEDQQKKLKDIAMEVFGEARDMYSDMKGDSAS